MAFRELGDSPVVQPVSGQTLRAMAKAAAIFC
jgi:hypothetical protein